MTACPMCNGTGVALVVNEDHGLDMSDPVAEMSMRCGFDGPHDAHTWQMSATGYCDCPGNPLSTHPNDL